MRNLIQITVRTKRVLKRNAGSLTISLGVLPRLQPLFSMQGGIYIHAMHKATLSSCLPPQKMCATSMTKNYGTRNKTQNIGTQRLIEPFCRGTKGAPPRARGVLNVIGIWVEFRETVKKIVPQHKISITLLCTFAAS